MLDPHSSLRSFRRSLLLRSLFLLLLILPGPAARALDVAFTVAMPKPWTHMLDVEMRVTGATGKTADLVMPVWTPGSYVVREYARNVQDFTAVGADGGALRWRKTSKNVWQVETGGATAFTARYRVYANELKVQLLEVTDDHAFWNNGGVLLHVANALKSPATLTVRAPEGWKAATGLAPVPGKPNTFRAEDFDELYDCPVEVGKHDETTFAVRGVPHRVVFYGKPGAMPLERIRDDIKRIVEAEVALMGDIPYRDYTFIVHVRRGAGGGLEHRNSCVLGATVDDFRDDYFGFLSLAAHEFFHLWNVKRIRPDGLGPFDYSHENHTRLLWVAEGITSYYEPIFLRRAGFLPPEGMLAYLSSLVRAVETTPGRRVMSLEDASFDAWIKFYRKDENAANSQVSYYDKGAVVALLLDLTIRGRSGGKKSLDDVLRTLYAEFGKQGRNVTPEDFQKVCETAAGDSLEPFFAKYVRGTEELDYDAALKTVGLRLDRGGSESQEAYLGANFAADPAGVKVTSVLADTPAYEQGVSANDLIVALDGMRVTSPTELTNRLSEKSPGETIRLTLFRVDALRTLEIKLGGQARAYYRFAALPNRTEEQQRQYRAWLEAAR
jgi:predicted metalloprotease with PDZ domain